MILYDSWKSLNDDFSASAIWLLKFRVELFQIMKYSRTILWNSEKILQNSEKILQDSEKILQNSEKILQDSEKILQNLSSNEQMTEMKSRLE